MGDVIISVKKVSLSYRLRRSFFRHDYHEVLKNISFDVKRGETLGIIGGNGEGKSTLLKLLSGIYKPDRGRVENKSTKTSLLTLQAGFDQELSGRDNALLSGMLLGYSKAYILDKLDDIKEYSELGEYFFQPLKTYSSGMKSRLGFATNTYLIPEVLLLDEVLGVGDTKFRKKSAETMKAMIRSDHTVVLVAQSPRTMIKLCNRVIWLEHGKVKVEGKPAEVLVDYPVA